MKHLATINKLLAGLSCAALLCSTPVLANEQPEISGQDIYRLYNGYSGEHFYTSNPDEKAALIQKGWIFEGIGWIAPSTGDAVYRLYNPNAQGGDHYYTKDLDEADSLVSLGWLMDNDAQPVFYSGGDINLYSAYNPNAQSGAHNYTTNRSEQDSLIDSGWLYDQVAWKVLGEGYEETDPSLYQRFAGQEFTLKTWGAAGGPSASMTISADGTYRETNTRLSMQPGIASEYSEFTGKLSDPVKVDDYTWKVHVVSSDLIQPVNTVLHEGNLSKIMLEPFAGLYSPMDFYIGSPDKPIEDYPAFVQDRYSILPDNLKDSFPGSYTLYTPDGMTFMSIKNQ